MTERFNVVRRAAGQALRPAPRRGGRVPDQGRPGARHRHHAGHVRPGLLHRAGPGGVAGAPRWSTAWAASLAHRRRDRRSAPWSRWPPARPALRPAHRAVQRAGRRDDRAGQLRAGLRGARPAADDRREAGRRRPCRAARPTVELDDVSFRYPTAGEVSLASLESVAVLDQAPSQQVLHDVSFAVPAGTMIALVGPVRAPARPPSPAWSRGSTTRSPARCSSAAATCATSSRTLRPPTRTSPEIVS